MKRNFYFLLMAALVCCLSLSVTSCKSDDDNNNDDEGEEFTDGPQNEQNEAATKFWNVVSQLVDIDEMSDDYKNASFEPTIGVEDPDNPQARIVYTNTAEAAAERFANLVGAEGLTEETTSFPWNDPNVGTLNYTKVTDGTAWATVDVNIKQVPKLEKIIYRAPEQEQGDNAKKQAVAGGRRAYYRFGDIVSRDVTNKDGTKTHEYWICVRPAFAPEGKADTYWACITGPLPKDNLWSWTYKNVNKKKKINVQRTYVLPTKLGEEKVQMQNLAELLYAIANPHGWYANVSGSTNKKFKFFDDFKKENLPYHNEYFWQNVQDQWTKTTGYFTGSNIICELFGFYNLADFQHAVLDGFHLLYAGYSWVSGNAPTLYQATYTTGTGDLESNNHKVTYTKVKKAVYDKNNPKNDIELDFSMSSYPYYKHLDFFGDTEPRYVVRIATGAELSNTGKYPDNEKAIPGVFDFYRYYGDVEKSKGDGMPEITNMYK